MQNKPEVLLFDLGGVIVPWTGIEELAALTGMSETQIKAFLKDFKVFGDYEIGQCSSDAFAKSMIEMFGLKLTRKQFLDTWNSWVKSPYPNTEDALKSLAKNYTLACLSNTNESHWAYLKSLINLEKHLEYTFASHKINAAKPDAKSYKIPIQKMGVKPKDVWFFDDTMINVISAERLGMTAFHVDRNVGVIPTLKELGLL